MKLVIVTTVEAFEKEVYKLFKKANIKIFSSSDIDGYKNVPPVIQASNWFSGEKTSTKSIMIFSFTKEGNIKTLFNLIEEFNENLETNNPIRAIVLPVEKSI